MMKYGKAYGGKHPVLEEGDIFRTIVYCPDFEGKTSVLRSQLESGVQPESQPESLRERILIVLKSNELSKSEISAKLGQKEISGPLNEVIRQLIKDGEIEYTIPDKPNSRLQKYRLKVG